MNKPIFLLFGAFYLFTIYTCTPSGDFKEEQAESIFSTDSLIVKTDALWEKYYSWTIDSTQIMDALESLKTEVNKNPQPMDLHLAYFQYTRGRVLYEEKSVQEAKESFALALETLQRNQPGLYPNLEARINQNLSVCYYHFKEYYLALEYSSKAAKFPDLLQDQLLASVYQQLARIYKRIGDLDNAKTYFENAIAIFKEEKDKHTGGEKRKLEQKWGSACRDIAFLLAEQLKTPEEAIPYLKNSLEVFSRLPEHPDKSYRPSRNQNFRSLANCYNAVGVAYDLMDFPKLALFYYQQALAVNQSIGRHQQVIGSNLNNIAIIYKKEGRLADAKKTSFAALANFDAKTNKSQVATVYDNLGDVYLEESDLDSAIISYNNALQNYIPGFFPSAYQDNPSVLADEIPDKEGVFISLSSKAKALRNFYQQDGSIAWLLASFDAYQKVDSLAAGMRLSFHSDNSKESLVKRTKPVYEEAIDLCLLLQNITGDSIYWGHAFNFAEKSKAIILLEAVRKAKAKLTIDESLWSLEKAINIRRNFFEREYALAAFEQMDDQYARDLLDSLSKYRTEHIEIIKAIGTTNPAYISLRSNSEMVDWKYIQDRLLNPGQTFIEYFTGEKAIYAFVIGKGYFEAIEIPLDFPLEEIINRFKVGIDSQYTTTYSESASILYSKVLAPLKQKKQLEERLIIVPDGMLSYIPFDALLSDSVSVIEGQFKHYPYLLKDHNISYNFSASLWKEMSSRTKKASAKKLLAGFAPSFSNGSSVSRAFYSREFGALKWNVPEVKAINELIGGDLYLADEATVTNFRENIFNYQIVHLATHAYANNNFGEYSFLIFAGSGQNAFEKFYAKDLYPLSINSDLVVLSACETGMGEWQDGEGVISLARAFSFAGASSVLTTLWLIEDETSKDLMLEFYQQILQNNDKATALYEAKKTYIKSQTINRSAHPFYWASFIPIGNMAPVKFDTR